MNEFEKLAVDRLDAAGFDKETAGKDYENLVRAYTDMASVPKQGLLLIGGAGSGKTFAMKTLAPNATFFDLTDPITNSILEPYEKYDKKDECMMTKWWVVEADHAVILDDMGNEPIKNDYGVKVQVVSNFIMRWYVDVFKRQDRKARLNATSNLNEGQLIDLYGARVTDRLFEMVSIVRFSSGSHRVPGRIYG